MSLLLELRCHGLLLRHVSDPISGPPSVAMLLWDLGQGCFQGAEEHVVSFPLRPSTFTAAFSNKKGSEAQFCYQYMLQKCCVQTAAQTPVHDVP